MGAMENIAALPNKRNWKYHAERIVEAWQKQVPCILDVGRLLITAKQELDHGTYEAMVQKDLPFGRSTARKLKIIAEHPIISNRSFINVLPPSWGILYELTQLQDDAILAALKDGSIHPKMKWRDVRKMSQVEQPKTATTAETTEIAPKKAPGPRIHGMPDGVLVSQWISSLKEERKRNGLEAAAKKAGIFSSTFKAAAEIVELNELALKPKDQAICKLALLELDTTEHVASPYRMVLPISQKVWQRKKIVHDAEGAKRLVDEFRDRVSSLTETCEMATTFKVPYLTQELARPFIKELKNARKAISNLLDMIDKEVAS